jgi:hypothetical protein
MQRLGKGLQGTFFSYTQFVFFCACAYPSHTTTPTTQHKIVVVAVVEAQEDEGSSINNNTNTHKKQQAYLLFKQLYTHTNSAFTLLLYYNTRTEI